VSDRTAYDIIYEKIDNENLKKVIHDHYTNDNWSENQSSLTALSNDQKLAHFDILVAKIFQIRQSSLLYNYRESLAFIDEILPLVDENNNEISYRALKGFIRHTIAITLAYLGKMRVQRFNDNYNSACIIYNELGMVQDLNRLKTEYIDVKYYYTDIFLLEDLLKETRDLHDSVQTPVEKLELVFRLAAFNLLNFINNNINNNKKNIIYSEEYFLEYIEKNESDNYKTYWAKCGLLITKHYQNKPIDKSFFEESIPSGSMSKAKGFPIILFLIARAHIIAGKEKKAKDLFFGVERRVNELLDQFPHDLDYQIIVLERFGLVLEEWINYNIKNTEEPVLDRICHVIHVNELLQNRLLLKDKFSLSILDDGLFNAMGRIQKILDSGKSLIYSTIKIKNDNNEQKQYVIVINGLMEEDVEIVELDYKYINQIKLKFSTTFLTDSKKEEQDDILNEYGNLLKPMIEKLNLNEYMVVPNELFSLLPMHMAREKGKYLYETKQFNYLPNLTFFTKQKKDININLGVYYSTEEENSIDEAKALESKFSAKLYPDPNIETFKTINDHNAVHIVAHHHDGHLRFKDHTINTDELINLFSGNINFASFNICNSFNQEDMKPRHPLYSKSVAQQVISRGINTVLTHNWELGQRAALLFSKYYPSKTMPKEMNQFKPSEYGGYMFWGGHLIGK